MINHPNRSKKSALKSAASEEILSYKGFDKDFVCRDYKFEIEKTYSHEGEVEACSGGFHACEHPLDVLSYYPPGTSRFAIVRQSGDLSMHEDDSKVASRTITIEKEITLDDLIKAAVKRTFDNANWKDGPVATGDNEGALTKEKNGAATASGDSGAATASGYRGMARGKDGCALFLVYHKEYRGPIIHAWAGIAGRDGIKPDTWYVLGADGKPVEA